MAQQYVMIRVPVLVHQRLVRISKEMLCAKEAARGYDDVPLTEQGDKIFVPLHAVITRLANECEGHKRRSNCRRRGTTTKTQ